MNSTKNYSDGGPGTLFGRRPFLVGAIATIPLGAAHAGDQVTPSEAQAIAIDADVYGYSLITAEVTRVQITNVPKAEGMRAPMGKFVNVERYPPGDYRGVSAPNADTLYSLSWLDVGPEPRAAAPPEERLRPT